MIIRYKNVIIDGKDKSGQVEDLPDALAQHLVKLGHAELWAEVPQAQAAADEKAPSKKRNRPWA
jgi:hypothetical protein